MHHALHILLRILAGIAGALLLYVAFFLYEDEEARIQNRLEQIWGRIKALQTNALSKEAAFIQQSTSTANSAASLRRKTSDSPRPTKRSTRQNLKCVRAPVPSECLASALRPPAWGFPPTLPLVVCSSRSATVPESLASAVSDSPASRRLSCRRSPDFLCSTSPVARPAADSPCRRPLPSLARCYPGDDVLRAATFLFLPGDRCFASSLKIVPP